MSVLVLSTVYKEEEKDGIYPPTRAAGCADRQIVWCALKVPPFAAALVFVRFDCKASSSLSSSSGAYIYAYFPTFRDMVKVARFREIEE